MSKLNTALNAIGTVAALSSLFGRNSPEGAAGKYNRFYSELRKNSIAKTNLFDVQITAPPLLISPNTKEVASKLSLYAEGSVLPGIFLQTGDLKRFGYGPNEKYPYSLQTNAISLNFFGDGQGIVYKFFYNWIQSIVRGDLEITGTLSNLSNNGLAPYEVEFKENYATTIRLFLYTEQGDEILQYELLEAFPVRIPDVPVAWSNENSIMQFAVDFEFLQSRLVNADEKFLIGKNGVKQLSPFQQLIKLSTAVQAISSLRRPRNVQEALSSTTTVKNIFV